MVFNIISKFMKLKYLPLIGVVLMAACVITAVTLSKRC